MVGRTCALRGKCPSIMLRGSMTTCTASFVVTSCACLARYTFCTPLQHYKIERLAF